jgi:V/A-type H+/Na+-transporting ATPase subunit D
MRTLNNPPTRQELLLLKKRIMTAQRGKSLLKDKRDSLIRMFLAVINEAIELQTKVYESYFSILDYYYRAEARMSHEYITALANTTTASIELDTEFQTQMGVRLPTVRATITEGRLITVICIRIRILTRQYPGCGS